MAETIDQLLVSLGLETDAKSFQAANDAMKSVKDGILQLAATAGTGMGFKALTAGVAKSYSELKRLADITGFTVNQIRGLEFAMRRIGANPESGQRLAQMIPDLARRAKYGELGKGAYMSGKFNSAEFQRLAERDQVAATEYLFNAYSSMNQQQRSWFRKGVGWGENDDVARLAEYGGGYFRQSMKMSADYTRDIDPEMSGSAQEFNDEMAKLSRNFEDLAYAMGKYLLPVVNDLLGAINKFIKENPEVSQALLAAAGVGGTAAAMRVGGRLIGMGGRGSAAGGAAAAAGGRFGAQFLKRTALGLLIPENSFVSASDARGMSNPALNWQQRHSGQPLPAGGGVTPEQAYFASLANNQNAKKYLDAIAKAEGTAGYMNAGYNTAFGGAQFADMSDHPRILRPFQQTDGSWNKTSAAGRYQFTQQSWDEAAAALGLTDFSPRSQDMAALWLIQRAGQLKNVLSGNYMAATNGLGGVWASLPSSPYAQPTRSYDEMAGYYGYQNTPPSTNFSTGGAQTGPQFNIEVDARGAADPGATVRQVESATQRAAEVWANSLELSQGSQ